MVEDSENLFSFSNVNKSTLCQKLKLNFTLINVVFRQKFNSSKDSFLVLL